jgi:hypothetical protein
MKHAGEAALAGLAALLAVLRTRPGLVERKLGVFYRKSQAFAHFHEDRAGMFGDLREGGQWRRLDVTTSAGQQAFLAAVDKEIEARK